MSNNFNEDYLKVILLSFPFCQFLSELRAMKSLKTIRAYSVSVLSLNIFITCLSVIQMCYIITEKMLSSHISVK